MRTVKATVISILALGLLAGSAVGVAAQEADTTASSSAFTIQFAGEPVVKMPPGTGILTVVEPIEATDERASGTLTSVVLAARADVANRDGGLVQTFAVRIENDAGSWVGSSRGFTTYPSDGPETVQELAELVGEGGYDGLTLFWAATGVSGDFRWLGVILPTDEIPAVPDLPAQ